MKQPPISNKRETDTHIIPVLEDELHTLSGKCKCEPVMDIDLHGHITWIHVNLINDHLINRLDVDIK